MTFVLAGVEHNLADNLPALLACFYPFNAS